MNAPADQTQDGLKLSSIDNVTLSEGKGGTIRTRTLRSGTGRVRCDTAVDAVQNMSLFAAFDLASGSVIAQHYRRHRHQEFLRFLKLIDAAVPGDLELHLVLDNYATHKTPAIHKWLLRPPPGSTCTSRPPAHRGSTWSNGGSPS
jgi:hypothetical protein